MTDRRQRVWTGKRIKHYRLGLDLTQDALATEVMERSGRRVKLTQSTISRWESGDSEISLRYKRVLAEALEVPRDILFEVPPDGWTAPLTPEQVAA